VARARARVAGLGALGRRLPLPQLAAVAGLFIYASIALEGFSDRTSVYSMLILASFLGLAGAGQTIVLLIGGLDLSIAAVISAANIMTAELTGTYRWPAVAAFALIAALAGCVGALNGYLCHRFRVQPLVVTLGTGAAVAGGILAWTGGNVTGTAPRWLGTVSSPAGTVLGIPFPPVVLLWACVMLLMAVVLQRTVVGRRVYATGSNRRAADLALVPTRRIWTGAFAVSALYSALVGVLLAGFSGSGDQTIGDPYLFQSLAAVILGGTTLIGARGDYWRTAAGALFLTELTTVLDGFGLSPAGQQIVFGLLILLAVAAFGRQPRLRDRL
jgi:ribose transport system permease protein